MPKLDTSDSVSFYRFCYNATHLVCTQEEFDTSGVTTLNFNEAFRNCPNLIVAPRLDLSMATSVSNMFYDDSSMVGSVEFDLNSCTSANGMFTNCSSLENITLRNTGGITNMQIMFSSCSSLKKLDALDMSSVTNFTNTLNNIRSIQFLKLVNLGKSSLTTYSFIQTAFDGWGENSADVPDALESLVWTFKNLYDRTGNGMSGCTISLNRNVYDRLMAQLTDAEKATYFTNKGYTITRS
jgi:hypothetical protein